VWSVSIKKVLEKPAASIFMILIWESEVLIQCTVQAVPQVSNSTKIRQAKSQADACGETKHALCVTMREGA